jgi:chromosome segregation ATPase
MGDDACDDGRDGAWLTYDQLAEVRHITRRAAVRMTQRHRLRRQPGNDGHVRVWVPHDMASPSQRQSHHDDGGDDASDDARDTGLLAGALSTLEDAVSALREQLDAANTRADRAEAAVAAERLRADRAETTVAAERQRADDVRAQIGVLNAEMVVMRAEADRALAEERLRADRLGWQVEALSAEVVRAEKQAEAVVGRAERAEAGRDAERARADALRSTIEDLRTEREVAARDLGLARHDALAAQQAAAKADARTARAEQGEETERSRADTINAQLEATQEELAGQRALTDAARQDAQAVQEVAAALRRADDARKARGRLRRAWDGWRGR